MAQTNDDNSLHYDALAAGEFRILIILRSKDPSSEIECCLVHEPLPGTTPYSALSYTWGTDAPSYPVKINGSVALVRENLYQALHRFRRRKTERRIWIDAICINQADTDERNAQVGQMRDTYSNARAVLIWLGEDPSLTADHAFRFIPRLTRYLKNLDWSQSQDGLRKLFSSHFIGSLACIFWLLQRSWWERVWTYQEVVVSKRPPNFYCGQGVLNWSSFEKLSKVWTESELVKFALQDRSDSGTSMEMFILLQEIFSLVFAITTGRATYHSGIGQSLHLLITVTHSHLATDPRDKIYALLGLVRPDFPLKADYRQSLNWVTIETMTQLLLQDDNLRGFGLREGRAENEDQTLPSWVFDISDIKHSRKPTISSKMGIIMDIPENFKYAAGSPNFLISPQFEDGGSVLVLRGVSVDTIQTLGEPSPAPVNVGEESGSIGTILENWMTLAGIAHFEEGVSTPDMSTQRDQFWRIMCLDRTLETQDRLPKHIVLNAARGKEQEWMVEMIDRTRGALFHGRRFMLTSKGMMGIGPKIARTGDIVCVLDGGEVPYVLRPLAEGYYRLIGECYVHGIMDGEVLEDEKRGKYASRNFRIK